jgi:hypothetical protein
MLFADQLVTETTTIRLMCAMQTKILKKGGLKDDNTIVFMYDYIAHNLENSNLGTIMMLIYFICSTNTVRLQRDQSTRKAKSKGRVGEQDGLDCMHLHNSVQLIVGIKTSIANIC